MWRAGGPAVPNTSGTITSQVSANTDYGFSIVSYTGNGSIAQTIGHGLSSAPKWIIAKNLDYSIGWPVYHSGVGPGNSLFLNTDGTPSGGTGIWGNVDPTNSVFTVANDPEANKNGDNYIAYCWSEVSGYSKFGTYTGNGSTTGPVITTGFKPRWILVKNTSSSARWIVWDTERDDDTLDKGLSPNLNSAEVTAFNANILSDGFQIVDSETTLNENNSTFIYAAFADRPGNNWDVNNIVTNEGLTTSKDNFDILTWTGDGSSSRAITGLRFSPGMLWVKRRNSALDHFIWDSVRGITKELYPNQNYSEGTATNKIESFDDNGFTVKTTVV